MKFADLKTEFEVSNIKPTRHLPIQNIYNPNSTPIQVLQHTIPIKQRIIMNPPSYTPDYLYHNTNQIFKKP